MDHNDSQYMDQKIYRNKKQVLKKYLFSLLNPNLGGGHYCPDDHEWPDCFNRELWPTKFITLLLFMFEWSHESQFWDMFLKFLKNVKKNFWRFWQQSVPFWKKIKNLQKIFFCKRIILSSFRLCIVHVLSFLLVYKTLVHLKNLNFELFSHKQFHFSNIIFRQQALPKLQLIKCCF